MVQISGGQHVTAYSVVDGNLVFTPASVGVLFAAASASTGYSDCYLEFSEDEYIVDCRYEFSEDNNDNISYVRVYNEGVLVGVQAFRYLKKLE